MFNNKFSTISERLRILSHGETEITLKRWRTVHHTSENTRRSLLVADPALMAQETTPDLETVNTNRDEKASSAEVSRIGTSVLEAERYSQYRDEIGQEAESVSRQRLADQARLLRDAAFDSLQDAKENHEYDLPA